jgi:hypothetical protein
MKQKQAIEQDIKESQQAYRAGYSSGKYDANSTRKREFFKAESEYTLGYCNGYDDAEKLHTL